MNKKTYPEVKPFVSDTLINEKYLRECEGDPKFCSSSAEHIFITGAEFVREVYEPRLRRYESELSKLREQNEEKDVSYNNLYATAQAATEELLKLRKQNEDTEKSKMVLLCGFTEYLNNNNLLRGTSELKTEHEIVRSFLSRSDNQQSTH